MIAEKKAINLLNTYMDKYGITNPYMKTAILGIILSEGGFDGHPENMNYSKERLPEVWGKFSKTGKVVKKGQGKYNYNELAINLEHKPEDLANFIYGDRLGNGGKNTNDGWTYRGRGLNQLTGKGSYKKLGKQLGVDLINNPELLDEDPELQAHAAVLFIHNRINKTLPRLVKNNSSYKKRFEDYLDYNNIDNLEDASFLLTSANAGFGNYPSKEKFAKRLRKAQPYLKNYNLTDPGEGKSKDKLLGPESIKGQTGTPLDKIPITNKDKILGKEKKDEKINDDIDEEDDEVLEDQIQSSQGPYADAIPNTNTDAFRLSDEHQMALFGQILYPRSKKRINQQQSINPLASLISQKDDEETEEVDEGSDVEETINTEESVVETSDDTFGVLKSDANSQKPAGPKDPRKALLDGDISQEEYDKIIKPIGSYVADFERQIEELNKESSTTLNDVNSSLKKVYKEKLDQATTAKEKQDLAKQYFQAMSVIAGGQTANAKGNELLKEAKAYWKTKKGKDKEQSALQEKVDYLKKYFSGSRGAYENQEKLRKTNPRYADVLQNFLDGTTSLKDFQKGLRKTANLEKDYEELNKELTGYDKRVGKPYTNSIGGISYSLTQDQKNHRRKLATEFAKKYGYNTDSWVTDIELENDESTDILEDGLFKSSLKKDLSDYQTKHKRFNRLASKFIENDWTVDKDGNIYNEEGEKGGSTIQQMVDYENEASQLWDFNIHDYVDDPNKTEQINLETLEYNCKKEGKVWIPLLAKCGTSAEAIKWKKACPHDRVRDPKTGRCECRGGKVDMYGRCAGQESLGNIAVDFSDPFLEIGLEKVVDAGFGVYDAGKQGINWIGDKGTDFRKWAGFLEGGSVEMDLNQDQVDRYVRGGYVLEELHEGGEPGHTHKDRTEYIKRIDDFLDIEGALPLDLVYGNEKLGIPKMGTLSSMKNIPDIADYFFDPSGDQYDKYVAERGDPKERKKAEKRVRETYLANVGRTEKEDEEYENKKIKEKAIEDTQYRKEQEQLEMESGQDIQGNPIPQWKLAGASNPDEYYKDVHDPGYNYLGEYANIANELTGIPSISRTYDRLKDDPLQLAKDVGTTIKDIQTLPFNLAKETYDYTLGDGKFEGENLANLHSLGVTGDVFGSLPWIGGGIKGLKTGSKYAKDIIGAAGKLKKIPRKLKVASVDKFNPVADINKALVKTTDDVVKELTDFNKVQHYKNMKSNMVDLRGQKYITPEVYNARLKSNPNSKLVQQVESGEIKVLQRKTNDGKNKWLSRILNQETDLALPPEKFKIVDEQIKIKLDRMKSEKGRKLLKEQEKAYINQTLNAEGKITVKEIDEMSEAAAQARIDEIENLFKNKNYAATEEITAWHRRSPEFDDLYHGSGQYMGNINKTLGPKNKDATIGFNPNYVTKKNPAVIHHEAGHISPAGRDLPMEKELIEAVGIPNFGKNLKAGNEIDDEAFRAYNYFVQKKRRGESLVMKLRRIDPVKNQSLTKGQLFDKYKNIQFDESLPPSMNDLGLDIKSHTLTSGEPLPYAQGYKQHLIDQGLIKDWFDPITEDILIQSQKLNQQNPKGYFKSSFSNRELDEFGNVQSTSRILDFTDPSRYKQLAKALNKVAPVVAAPVVATSMLDNKKDGGFVLDLSPKQVEQYKRGGYIVEEMHEGGTPHKHPHDPPENDYRKLMPWMSEENINFISNINPSTAPVKKRQLVFGEPGFREQQRSLNHQRGQLLSPSHQLKLRLRDSITPIGYDVKHAAKEFIAGKRLPFTWDGKQTTFDDFDKLDRWKNPETGEMGWYGKYVKDASKDAWNMYLGFDQESDTYKPSFYQPSSSKNKSANYYSFNYDDDIWDEALNNKVLNLKKGESKYIKDSSSGGFTLQNYKLGKGYDSKLKLPYISYYDKNDYNIDLGAFGNIKGEDIVGEAFEVYGRMYYDPKTKKRVFPESKPKKEEADKYRAGGYILEEVYEDDPGTGKSYTVKDGDTFDAIAYDNGFTPDQLAAANPTIKDRKFITIGLVINFPEKKAATKIAAKKTHSKKLKAPKDEFEYDDAKFINEVYMPELLSQENAGKAGYDPKTNLWYPTKAPEKGGGYDIFAGHKVQKGEDFSKGITTEEGHAQMRKDFESKKKNASKYINKTYGEDTFESLPIYSQAILTDYEYNVKGGIGTFKNFARGVVNNDKDLMLKEYVRYSDGKPLGRRNEMMKNWINKYYEEDKKQDGGFVELNLSKEQAQMYADGGYIVEEID